MVGVIYQNMYLAFFERGNEQASLIFLRGDVPPLINAEMPAKALFVENATASVYLVNPTDNKIYKLDADPVNNLFYEWKSKKFVLPQPTNFAALKAQADWAFLADADAYNALIAEIEARNQAIWDSGVDLGATVNDYVINSEAINGSILESLPTQAEGRNVQVLVEADGEQIAVAAITDQEPIRMPARTKAYVYEMTITGNAPLRQIDMATSIGELQSI
jgi:hypothetical protein